MSIENRRLKLPHSRGGLLLRSENRKRSSFGEGIESKYDTNVIFFQVSTRLANEMKKEYRK